MIKDSQRWPNCTCEILTGFAQGQSFVSTLPSNILRLFEFLFAFNILIVSVKRNTEIKPLYLVQIHSKKSQNVFKGNL